MSSTSAISSTETSQIPAATSSAVTHTLSAGKNLKVVGIILAIVSGLLIGSSFVFKKKGLLRAQAGGVAGEGVGYLKSALWWIGMTMMIVGEICNFAAYAFVEAIVVTPLGALSVVICAILSSIFLNEKLSFFGWLGCGLCILGSVIIALNGPHEDSVGQIKEFQKLFLAPGFLVYTSLLIAISLAIIFYFAPRYGKKSMLWYIAVCSMIGGISVSVTTGLGAAIVQTAMGDNQFKFWFMYFLMAFVVVTLLTEVYYLNVALALFNTAMVTPTYYVTFTFFSMVTTVVLFKGLQASAAQIITIAMAFLVICVGITILQMSKVDPVQLTKLDRRSTILLQAARSQTETMEEKGAVGVEDPGMDALRGSFGTVGSIIRARSAKRMSQNSTRPNFRTRPQGFIGSTYDPTSLHSDHHYSLPTTGGNDHLAGIKRHQLYDAPVPTADDASSRASIHSQLMNKRPTIKFDSQDVVHQYNRPGTGSNAATHEHRQAIGSPRPPNDGYPPLPPHPVTTTSLDKEEPEDYLSESPEVDSPLKPLEPGQLISVPPPRPTEPQIHSAPPAVFARFPKPNARDLFNNTQDMSTAGTRGTLISFPSVTESSPSQSYREDDLETLETLNTVRSDREKEKEKDRPYSSRRYPRSGDDIDREESESLWQRGTDTDTDESFPSSGGIRLVQHDERHRQQ